MAESTVKKSRFKTILKAAAIVAAIVILLLGGAFLWLRSAAGERFIFERIAAGLAEKGFELKAAEIGGPLPERLYLRDVKLADKDGPIARLAEAELRLNLRGLLLKNKILYVERLALIKPELIRLPKVKKSADEKAPTGFRLPLDVQFTDLLIREGQLPGALFAENSDKPLNFSLSGKGHVSNSLFFTIAEINVAIADLAALNPALAGPLEAGLCLRGGLASLSFQADLKSPALTTQVGLLENVSARFSLGGRPLNDTLLLEPDFTGTLNIEATSSPAGPLNLATDWSFNSEGGIQAAVQKLQASLGALNFAGDMSADLRGERPALNGSLTAETADWLPLAALLGQPLSGSPARLSVNLAAENNLQSAAVDLDAPMLRLAGPEGQGDLLALNDSTAKITATNLFGEADLEADISLGAGLAATAKWSGASIKASGHTGDGSFSLEVNGLELAGFGGTAGDGLHLVGAYHVNERALDIQRLDLLLASSGLKLTSPARLGFGENITLSPAALDILPTGQLSAELDLRPDSLKLAADLSSLPFSFVKPFVGPEIFVPEGMLESFSVDMQQGPEGLSGTLDLSTAVEYQGLAPKLALRGEIVGSRNKPVLSLNGRIEGGPGWDSGGDLKGSLPFIISPIPSSGPQFDYMAPLNASLNWSGDIAPLWKLAGQPDQQVTGRIAVEARENGSWARSQAEATIYLAGGRYEDKLLGLLINDITMEAHYNARDWLRATLAAKDSRGGGLALQAALNKAAGGPELSATGRLGRFNPWQRDDLNAYVSGDIAATGPLSRPTLSSKLTVDRGELDLKVLMASKSIPTLTIAEGDESVASDRGPRFDLKISVPNQFFIRGYGLDSEWQGDLAVGGFAARPSLSGRLAPVRGYFEIFSREFQFTGGDISFNGGVDPNLNLELTNNAPSITALIKVEGRGTAPSLSMSSRPPQPQEEVLAQVLFGKNASSLSRFEALQLAASLRELTSFGEGGFSFDPVSSVRKELGLDVLRIGGAGGGEGERAVSDLSGSLGQDMQGGTAANTESLSGTTLEAGKYLNDKVYVGVEHNTSGSSAVRVEMELSPRLSLEARSSTESSQVGIGWKKDY